MIIVLSGEGPSDLGTCVNRQGECSIPDFQYGPMMMLVDKEIEKNHHYSPLEVYNGNYVFISKTKLTELMRAKSARKVALRGKKQPDAERGFFFDNAWMLGEETLRHSNEREDTAIAVLFRDCDGNNQSGLELWCAKIESVRQGFMRSGLGERGIAMIPRPKSEAWMLCAIQNDYQHCARLEDTLPGNDDAPNSAKMQLDEAMAHASGSQDQVNWIWEHNFDVAALADEMESYREFSQGLKRALDSL
ncbi:hypothetical protein [Pectobacterium sp. CHL-2024]|uniref:hypothetical protein n=1 Tax=Pectobacterium sp. CHL-2024 TaxID=3377079 RepID=UPI0037F24C2B